MTPVSEYDIQKSRLGPNPSPIEFEASVMNGYWPMNETCRRVKFTFKENLPSILSGKILDLGCSIGLTTEEIAHIYPNCNIYGLDLNPKTIEIAKERVKNRNIEFIVGDGFKQPFSAEYFNGIFCMNNLGFTFNPGEPQIFKGHLDNVLSMLKNESYLLFSGGLCTVAVLQKIDPGHKIISLWVGEQENEQYMAKFLLKNYHT
jgi:SAM-dependent methyltransferase